ncbi:putative uncharacterized protein [Clostridium sp. CAG:411]|jgi:hypothetical protein|nr:DUF5050 domain-containing protein [Lachnospiraceae bacterium]CDE44657.1 putative uncharacterized protein [Clostridium sp. CAG:411]
MKKKILPIILILALCVLVIISYRSRQTVYNDEHTIGNSSGNLFNGGLFCEYDKHIYFSNPSDEGRLYVMNSDLSNLKKLSTDTADGINVAGKYIIYGRHNQNQNQTTENVFETSKTGLYRMDKTGGHLKTLFDSVVNMVALYGNTVYFQHNTDTGFGIGKINIDKSKEGELSTEAIYPYTIQDGFLYYTGVSDNHNIYKMDLNTGDSTSLEEGNFAYVTASNDFLYCLDLNNNHVLTRMKLDGSNKLVLVKEPTSTYNVTPDGMYLYYQVDLGNNGEGNAIYRRNLNSQETTLLKKGTFSNIHTTSKYTFFKDCQKDDYYVVENTDTGMPDTWNVAADSSDKN